METEQKRTQEGKKKLLAALEMSLGIVTEACEKADITRSRHYAWMQSDEEYKKAVDDIDSKFIDFAETSLKKQIKEGNTTATTFFLRTRGRKRGYNEKQEIDLTSGDERIKININLVSLLLLRGVCSSSCDPRAAPRPRCSRAGRSRC